MLLANITVAKRILRQYPTLGGFSSRRYPTRITWLHAWPGSQKDICSAQEHGL